MCLQHGDHKLVGLVSTSLHFAACSANLNLNAERVFRVATTSSPPNSAKKGVGPFNTFVISESELQRVRTFWNLLFIDSIFKTQERNFQ